MHLLLFGIAVGFVLGWLFNSYWPEIVSLATSKKTKEKIDVVEGTKFQRDEEADT